MQQCQQHIYICQSVMFSQCHNKLLHTDTSPQWRGPKNKVSKYKSFDIKQYVYQIISYIFMFNCNFRKKNKSKMETDIGM